MEKTLDGQKWFLLGANGNLHILEYIANHQRIFLKGFLTISKPFITAHASWVNSFQFPVGSSSIPLTNWIVSVASSPPQKKRTHNLRTQFGDWSRVLSIFWGCYIHAYEHQLCELRASKAGGHQPYTKNTQEGATDMPLLKCPRFAWVQPSICAICSILSILLLLLQQFLLFDGFGICKERLEESAGAFLGSCAFVVFSRALSGGSKDMNMLTTFTFKTISTAGVTREVSPGRQPCPWPYARIFATCP